MRQRVLIVNTKKQRSRVTNGALPAGLDGRSAAGRRYRDLQIAYADDLGGAAALTEADKALVRQAAAITVQSEEMQAAIVRGEAVDTAQMVRLSNLLTRLLKTVRSRAKSAAPAKRTLRDLIREHEVAA